MTHVLRIVLKFNLFKDFSISVIPKILFHCLGREKRHHYPSLVSVLFPFAGAWTRLAGARVARAPRRTPTCRGVCELPGLRRPPPARSGRRPPATASARALLPLLLLLAPPCSSSSRWQLRLLLSARKLGLEEVCGVHHRASPCAIHWTAAEGAATSTCSMAPG